MDSPVKLRLVILYTLKSENRVGIESERLLREDAQMTIFVVKDVRFTSFKFDDYQNVCMAYKIIVLDLK